MSVIMITLAIMNMIMITLAIIPRARDRLMIASVITPR